MGFQSVARTAQISVEYFGNTKIKINTFHAEHPGGYNLADIQELADAMDVVVANDWLPIQTQDITYQQVTVRGLEFENDFEVAVDTSSGDGLVAQVALPSNVTFSVKKASPVTGRSARGRIYWMGMHQAQLQANENLVKQADADAIEAAVEALRVKIDGTSWEPVIVSRFTAGAQRPFGVIFEWSETQVVNLTVDSHRGRLLD